MRKRNQGWKKFIGTAGYKNANQGSQEVTVDDHGSGAQKHISDVQVLLTVHTNEFSECAVVINPDQCPGFKPKDICIIKILDKNKQQLKNKDDSEIAVRLGENSLKSNWSKAVSLHKYLADLYKIDNRTHAWVTASEDKEAYELEKVELSIKDQFLTRRDQWYFCNYGLVNKTVYPMKYVDFCRARCRVKNIYRNNKKVNSGIISHKTKFCLYTKSSHTTVLVEMTKEMYEFDENGYTSTEKSVSFVRSLLERMNLTFTSHEVSIILFARLFYPQFKDIKDLHSKLYNKCPLLSPEMRDSYHHCFHINNEGEIFQDVYYKVGIAESSKNNWDNTLMKLKKIFNYFPSLINWSYNNSKVKTLSKCYPALNFSKGFRSMYSSAAFSDQFIKPQHLLDCELGPSIKTNFLEAVNLAMKNYHIDQSTKHTGAQIIVVTAGSGIYRVCPDIALPTRRRVLQQGILVRVVSVNRPPTYLAKPNKTPVFIYKCYSGHHRRNADYDPFHTKEEEMREIPGDYGPRPKASSMGFGRPQEPQQNLGFDDE